MKQNATEDIRPIIIALMAAVFPNFPNLSTGTMIWCGVLWGYMLLAPEYRWPRPNQWIRSLLILLTVATVLLEAGLRLGGHAYLNLMAAMAALKPMEIESYRDRMVALFMAYFIVITSLFEAESLLVTIYMFFSILLTTAVLVHTHAPRSSLKTDLRLAGRILLQAFPLMLALFFLFPRVQGSLWGIVRRPIAQTGFSDRLTMGDVSRLVYDDAVVFKATFEGPLPDTDQLYWRGLVFWRFDGRKWAPAVNVPLKMPKTPPTISHTYELTLEPHGKRWLFALDLPVAPPPQARLYADDTLKTSRSVRKKAHFRMRNTRVYDTTPLRTWEFRAALQLPEDGNPRARALAARWAASRRSTAAVVQTALTYFKSNAFSYTLHPPRLGRNPVDEFLFNTRKGYCEHFASAFAFLMRAAGIPCRIVVGYLGGEPNPFGNFLVLRQSDAHAWTEVWQKQRGWVRVDPTSAVAPARIQSGVAAALPAVELPDRLIRRPTDPLSDTLQQLRYRWDAVSNQWDIWFSGYSYTEQQTLLARVGIRTDTWSQQAKLLSLLLVGVLILATTLIIGWQFYQKRGRADPVRRLYAIYCDRLSAVGMPRRPAQGPLDYAQWVVSRKPELDDAVKRVTQLYIALRYAGKKDPKTLKQFRKAVKGFRPRSAPK